MGELEEVDLQKRTRMKGMKKYHMGNKFILLLLAISLSSAVWAQSFIHPGLLHTNDDFVRIKTQLAANEPAVVQGYNKLKTNEWSQLNVGTWPVEIIKRGIQGDENYINAARGAHIAYMHALRWKISGDEAHAKKAINVLNAWASTTTALGGNSNVSLASGIYGYEFANAAELMRDYEGWKPADFKIFQDWMMYVWYPYAIDFLLRRHGTWEQGRPGHYWSNWGLCNALCLISIGVLCDDVFVYNQGLSFYKYDYVGNFREDKTADDHLVNDGLTEFIGNLVPVVWEDDRGSFGQLGQMQESGRDQGHTLMAVGMAVDICQIAWKQGEDLFAFMNNRLAAGIEYIAAYNTGTNDLPWKNYWYHDVRTAIHNSWVQTGINEGGRGQHRPFWDRVLGHYTGIKGIDMPYSTIMRDQIGVDFGGGGGTSGGYDHLGYSTLTCTREAALPENAPTSISKSITYNGKTVQKGELMNVEKGSTLTLIPTLPSNETNTGIWQWSTGDTSKDLEITADSSFIYRVTYTNSPGVISSQLFSIAVVGDCLPDRYSTTININGKTYNDTLITVDQYSTVELEVNASSWRSTFDWSNSETSNSIIVNMENEDRTFTVQATNQGGNMATINFQLEVYPIGPGYKVNDGPVVNKKNASVSVDQTVTLMPVVKPGMEGGTWLWSNGSTNSNLVLDEVNESTEATVTYSLQGKEYSLTFNIYILSTSDAWGYWPMDEGSGNVVHDNWRGNDAQRNGGTWKKGILNNGVQLNGTANSFLTLPNEFIDPLNDFTIAIWVKPDALTKWARIWDFGNGTSNNMFITSSPGADANPMRFVIKAGGDEQLINSSRVLEVGEWSHVTVTKSDKLGILYLDGVEVGRNANISLSPSDLGMTNQNYIGKSQYPDPLFVGAVDEFRIYNRAFSKQEVVNLVNLLIVPLAPVNLTGEDVAGTVELKWDKVDGATGYSVKRSQASGGPYDVLRSSTIRNSYSDKSVESGTYYYVVSAINSTIESENSEEISVTLIPDGKTKVENTGCEIYPNPVHEKLTISIQNNIPVIFRMVTISGRMLIQKTLSTTENSIDLSGIRNGIYFVEIISDTEKRIVKLVKE